MLKIRYGKGPDQALGQRAMLVLVMQHHFVLSPDGAAQGGLPGFLHSRCITYFWHQQPAGIDLNAQRQGQIAADSGQSRLGSAGQLGIGLLAGLACAQ